MMYYAKGLKDILAEHRLTIEFFDELDDFQHNFIDVCFQKMIDQNMGMLTEVEYYNYELFQSYRAMINTTNWYGFDEVDIKKAA